MLELFILYVCLCLLEFQKNHLQSVDIKPGPNFDARVGKVFVDNICFLSKMILESSGWVRGQFNMDLYKKTKN